jgi:hypothetical protein
MRNLFCLRPRAWASSVRRWRRKNTMLRPSKILPCCKLDCLIQENSSDEKSDLACAAYRVCSTIPRIVLWPRTSGPTQHSGSEISRFE